MLYTLHVASEVTKMVFLCCTMCMHNLKSHRSLHSTNYMYPLKSHRSLHSTNLMYPLKSHRSLHSTEHMYPLKLHCFTAQTFSIITLKSPRRLHTVHTVCAIWSDIQGFYTALTVWIFWSHEGGFNTLHKLCLSLEVMWDILWQTAQTVFIIWSHRNSNTLQQTVFPHLKPGRKS